MYRYYIVIFHLLLAIPQVQILQDSYSANYGTSITLDCIVTAVPLHTVVTWRKTKSGTATNINVAASSGKYSGGTVSSPSLVINSANLDDEASYVCSAANSIGIGNSSSTVLDIVGGKKIINVLICPNYVIIKVCVYSNTSLKHNFDKTLLKTNSNNI